jgi:hypothetical protein
VTEPLVLALLCDAAAGAALAAGFEEEAVPLTVLAAEGEPGAPAEGEPRAPALAREAARRSLLGIGIGGDHERLTLVLSGAPGRVYLEAPITAARAFGHDAARIAARRPVRLGSAR